jgi:hypothetical protein
MSKKILNQALGYYNSSFFQMHIATDEKIERITDLSETAFATLIHEYIHFIQDITTLHGLQNIFNTIQYLKFAINEVYKTENEFHIPIEFSKVNIGDLGYFRSRIYDISYGYTDSYDDVEILDYHPLALPIDDRCIVNSMPVTELNIEIDGNYNDSYIFGAGCIYENMAYIMGRYMAQFGTVTSPDAPYNLATKLAEKIYKEFAEDELNVLAVCDIALNSSNPGKVFVEIIQEYKDKKIVPNDPRELYDDFYNRVFQNAEATKDGHFFSQTNYLDNFIKMAELVEKELYSYFRPAYPDAQDEFSVNMRLINDWIASVFASVKNWRTQNPYFIIDMADGGERYANKTFVQFYNEFGLPFCTNNNNDGCFYHPKFLTNELHISYFSAASQIFDILNGGFEMCDFYCYCRKCKMEGTGDVVVDSRCATPWQRCNDARICPVATIWKHWKLIGHTPVL